jgi:hypothetical protein
MKYWSQRKGHFGVMVAIEVFTEQRMGARRGNLSLPLMSIQVSMNL